MIRFGQIEICGHTKTIRNGARMMRCRSYAGNKRSFREAWVRFKVFKYLLLADGRGMTRSALFDLVYAGDPNGGPVKGVHIFDTQFRNWKKHLAHLDVTIKREKRGGEMYLRMVPVSHVV